MPQDHKRLCPVSAITAAVVTFALGTESTPPDRITTELSEYLICEQQDVATSTFTYFDFINFRFF